MKLRVTQKSIVLRNQSCAYCGAELSTANRTKDHVIARNSVPPGTLSRDWNLILRACSPCNNHKAELENDIPAITMLPSLHRDHQVAMAPFESAVEAKVAGSVSRLTKRPVAHSNISESLALPFMGGTATFGFVGPPQIAQERAIELCRLQIAAFFYCITYDLEKRTGGWWPGVFGLLAMTPRSDWGNPKHIAFMGAVKDWEPKLVGITAEGFFKIAVRRSPTEVLWSWALEWNQNYRMSGFFGDGAAAQTLVNTLPDDEGTKFMVSANEQWRVWKEISLDPAQDSMFFTGNDSPSENSDSNTPVATETSGG